MGSEDERRRFLTQVKKACRIGGKLRELGVRKYGVVRIDSAASPAEWASDPAGNTKGSCRRSARLAALRRIPANDSRLKAKSVGAAMHSWRTNVQLLEAVDRPQTLGYQADMAHTMLFTMGYNAEEDRLLPDDFDWSQRIAMNALTPPWPGRFVPGRSIFT